MRGFFLSLLILFLATVANGQVQQEKLKEHPHLENCKFSMVGIWRRFVSWLGRRK